MTVKLTKVRDDDYGRTVYDVLLDGEHVGYVERVAYRRPSRKSGRLVLSYGTDVEWHPYVLKNAEDKVGYGLNYSRGDFGGRKGYTQERVTIRPHHHNTRRDAVACIVGWVEDGRRWRKAPR